MSLPEKLAIQDTQDEEKQNTIGVGHHSTQANTSKTSDLLQTTGGKDESNIVAIWKPKWIPQHRTQNVKTHNRTTQKTS